MPRTTPTLNAQQHAVLEAFTQQHGHLALDAAPGSGKTLLLLTCVGSVDLDRTRVWLAAFSNQVARDLARRTPEHENLAVSTIHALGLLHVRRAVGEVHLWPDKYVHLARLLVEGQGGDPAQQEARAACLEGLATRAMLTLTDPQDPAALQRMALEHTADLGAWDQAWPLVAPLIRRGTEVALQEGQLAYSDMLYVPHALGLDSQSFDLVALDEAEDTSAAQRSLLLRSLAPGARVLAVGDSRQATYSFLGADTRAFGALKDALGARELPLHVCYRCPRRHLELANQVYNVLEAAPHARLGTVEELGLEEAQAALRPGDLVLCRTGAPLVALAHRLLGAGQRAHVLGRNLLPALRALIAHTCAQPGFSEEEFGVHLGAYAARAQQELEAHGPAGAMASASLWDRVHALRVIWDTQRPASVAALVRRTAELVGEDSLGRAIELATVHRAKGRQAKRVFLLRPDLLPHPRASTPQQQEQEQNLKYVALTRSTQALYFVHAA